MPFGNEEPVGSAVTKNSSLCQLSAMLMPTFFLLTVFFFFQQEHQSVQKSFTNAIVLLLLLLSAPLCPMLGTCSLATDLSSI